MDGDRAADWQVWGRIPDAKVWQLVALSLNIDPRKMLVQAGSWARDDVISMESDEFHDRLLVAKANVQGGRLPPVAAVLDAPGNSKVALNEFASWALSIDWTIPKELAALANQTKADLDTRLPNNKNSVGMTERDSLLKMVLGMAMGAYKYLPSEQRNTATGQNRGSIHADLQRFGLDLDADTIRRFIKEAEGRFSDLIANQRKS